MNAQDDQRASLARDAALLTTIDHVMAQPEAGTSDDSYSLEGFCTYLAVAAPQADPAFRNGLGHRLAVEIERRRRPAGPLPRFRAMVPKLPRRRLLLPGGRPRFASLMLAIVIAIGATGGYLHQQGATPVDARTLLQRAAAASPGPDEAVHEMYRLSTGGSNAGATEVWIGVDASGAPTQIAVSQTTLTGERQTSELSGRLVQTPQMLQVYDPASNTVTRSSSRRPLPTSSAAPGTSVQELEGMLVGAMVAQKLSRALASGAQANAFQLKLQTLDGESVYALRLDGAAGQTYYFNAQSYRLEGADWTRAGQSWQARLDPASYKTMPLSAVPVGSFTLNAPSSAHMVVLEAAVGRPKDSTSDETITTLAAACDTTVQTVEAAMQTGGTSLLDVCRETAPDMTTNNLVTALIVPFKTSLDAQVASSSITAAEEVNDLANLRLKLTFMVNGKAGTGVNGVPQKQP